MLKQQFKRMVLARHPRKRDVVLRAIYPTSAQVEELNGFYQAAFKPWEDHSTLLAAYKDSLDRLKMQDGPVALNDNISFIEYLIGLIVQKALDEQSAFELLLRAWSDRIIRWHIRKIVAAVESATDVDLSNFLTLADVTGSQVDFIAQNVSLVRDVSNQARGRIAGALYRGLQVRRPVEAVAREIDHATDLGRKRSRRIAIDQMNKFSSALDAERGRQLGFNGYDWLHSHKKHYRLIHLERDGETFEFGSEVDLNDPPGYAPFCGCKRRLRMVLQS